jgi:secreted PhoX family phosphatase
MVFTATSGGRQARGQVFRVSFTDNTLKLLAESTSDEEFNGPDNITVAPWGDLVVAEDGPDEQHVFGIRRDGTSYPMLRNRQSASELAGVCFSPDGSVLFCNMQRDGLTVAVRGPFHELFAGA